MFSGAVFPNQIKNIKKFIINRGARCVLGLSLLCVTWVQNKIFNREIIPTLSPSSEFSFEATMQTSKCKENHNTPCAPLFYPALNGCICHRCAIEDWYGSVAKNACVFVKYFLRLG